MSTLSTQSTTIKTYAFFDNKVFIFSSSGVDIYQTSYISWVRLGYAALSDVTSGTVNVNGIWLGTSDRGVWHCPIGNGDLTSQLRKYYATSGTSYVIQSDNINSLAGIDTKLLVCHSVGAEYFAATGTPVQYSDEATDNAAINGTYIAYSVATGLETLTFPSANWTSSGTTVLTTGSSPALSSNTVNDIRYGSGNNMFIAGGAGVDIYDYTDVTNIGSVAKYVWPSSTGTQAAGLMAYVDGNDDVIIYNITGTAVLDTAAGTFTAGWVDDQAALTVRNAELEKFFSIDYVSPSSKNRDVRRDWDLYFEVIDTLDDITTASNVVVKVNGGTVTTTKTAITDGYKVEFSPASSSGYRKTVTIDIEVTDDNSNVTNESYNFTTATVINTVSASTKAPSVVVYKDLSLGDAEDTYNGIKINWADETIEAYYVDEDQAKASAQVTIENGIYHKHFLNVRVYDTDESSNPTQNIKKGAILTIDVDVLGLVNKKCEVLSKQRTTQFDRIEYNLNLAYYVLWT